jgi:hypothetical protein
MGVAEDVGFGSLIKVLSTRAKHSANIENFKSFVTDMKYTPVDEHNPSKISFFHEDFKKLQKKTQEKNWDLSYEPKEAVAEGKPDGSINK